MQRINVIPLSIYIHFPWCLKKCPYCDFNSYPMTERILVEQYIESLLKDLANEARLYHGEQIQSIYFGGGTPSLMSPDTINKIIEAVKKDFIFTNDIEITLEANPGTVDLNLCLGLKKAGINRFSIGVQSFNNEKLKVLQRIHSAEEAVLAINAVKDAGFDNFNLDLMYGLPEQTVEDALSDLEQALSFKPPHVSWYQLTIIPEFLSQESSLKTIDSEVLWDIQQQGKEFLSNKSLKQYEVSAYSVSSELRSKHNINYWEHGDYIGIGAGAHSKMTHTGYEVVRKVKINEPAKYLESTDFIEAEQKISQKSMPLEFMLNALRLYQPIKETLFYERTGLRFGSITKELQQAQEMGLIEQQDRAIIVTNHGKNFLNNLLEIFL